MQRRRRGMHSSLRGHGVLILGSEEGGGSHLLLPRGRCRGATRRLGDRRLRCKWRGGGSRLSLACLGGRRPVRVWRRRRTSVGRAPHVGVRRRRRWKYGSILRPRHVLVTKPRTIVGIKSPRIIVRSCRKAREGRRVVVRGDPGRWQA